MPVIPAQLGASVEPDRPRGVFQSQNASAGSFGGYTAQALQGVGAATQQLGGVQANNVIRFQEQQNETDVNDVFANRFSPKFRELYQSYYGLQGKDALAKLPDFQKQMEEVRTETRNGLPNTQQKNLFDQISRRRVEAEFDGMARYAEQQNRVYRAQVQQDTLSNIRTMAADKYNDEQAFGRAIGEGAAEIHRFNAQTGRTDDTGEINKADVRKFTSELAVDRLSRWLNHDPMGAKAWYEKNKDLVEPGRRGQVEREIKVATVPLIATTDAMDIMRDGLPAVRDQIETGGPDARAGAADVVANTPDTLTSLKAALKRAEGSGPNQVSVQGATGSMQITRDTFDAYKKAGESFDNQKDRVAAAHRKIEDDFKFYGGDVSKVAAAYIGGRGAVRPDGTIREDVKDALGTTPKAYAERVVQILGRGSSGAPVTSRDVQAKLGEWIVEAEKRYPNDPIMRDAVISKIKGNISTIVAAKEGQQRQALDSLKPILVGQNAPTSLPELLAVPGTRDAVMSLDGAGLHYLTQHLESNQRRAMSLTVKSNPEVALGLLNRIYSDGPDKITSATQLLPFVKADGSGLSTHDFEAYQRHIAAAQTPEGKAFGTDRKHITDLARNMLMRSMIGQVMPEKALDGAKRFSDDLDRRIDQYRKEGKDPRNLFNSASKDYVASPERVMSFLPNAQTAIADQAAAVRQGAPATTAPINTTVKKVSNDAEYNALPAGTEFIDPKGVRRRKP